MNEGNVILETFFEDLTLAARGKVRDIYDFGEQLLIVATDRISAFDVVLNEPIPGKGHVLTKVSEFWFTKLAPVTKTHFVSSNMKDFPSKCTKYTSVLHGRSMLVTKAMPIPFECVVRGYLAGSAFQEYQKDRHICGITLPSGLKEADKLDPPIFTPATKAMQGDHDVNITFKEMEAELGHDLASHIRQKSLELYIRGSKTADEKGIIIADTKFEFGLKDDQVILIDELLTPDSSRFWPKESYLPGQSQESLDKQFVRNYLINTHWNKVPPPPSLPPDVISGTSSRYKKIMELLFS